MNFEDYPVLLPSELLMIVDQKYLFRLAAMGKVNQHLEELQMVRNTVVCFLNNGCLPCANNSEKLRCLLLLQLCVELEERVVVMLI